MAQQLTISLLGEPIVSLDEQALRAFAYDKVRALLYYLAVESSHPQPRDVVAELLWPEQPHGVARQNLRQALHNLRRVLGCDNAGLPYLLIERKTLQINRHTNLMVDVSHFTAHVAAVKGHAHAEGQLCTSCAAQLESAAALYRGDFLARFTLPDSSAFDDWLAAHSAQMHQDAIFVLSHVMAYQLQAASWKRAQEHALRLLAIEPWEERAHRGLMRLLVLQGQRSAALQQYNRCCDLLQQMFAMKPEPETVLLAEAIRSGELDTPSRGDPQEPPASMQPDPSPGLERSPSRLPRPGTALIGREHELAGISASLRLPDIRLITISGPGGIGKTRLSLAVAQAFQRSMPDGTWFIPLAGIRHHEHVASTIAHALGVKSEPGKPIEASLVHWLANKSALLVLDNFEHVIEAADLIGQLMAGTNELKILITSRELLKLYGEWEFQLPPLSLPAQHDQLLGDTLMRAEAIQLFVSRARAASTAILLTAETAPLVVEICRRLDGLPLAIELAAARTKLMSLPSLLARLNRRLDLLVDGPRDLPQRHKTLRATIDWSYQLLNAQEQQVFARLAIFAGSWTLAAACAIVMRTEQERQHSPEQTELETLRIIESLLIKSMIHQQRLQHDEMRFSMLETLCEYALCQLQARGELEQVGDKHAAYYLALAEQANARLFGAESDTWTRMLELEIDNLRKAFGWFVDRGAGAEALTFCASLWHFWRLRSYQSEGYRSAAQALALTPGLSIRPRATVLYGAGWMAHDLGNYNEALAYFEQSLALFRQLDDLAGVAEALQGIGEMAKRAYDYQRARECFTQSMELYRQLGNEEGVAWAFDHLGLIYFAEGNYQQAALLLAESLEAFRALQQRWGIAVTLQHAGMIELYQQHFERARQLLQESYELFSALGNRLMIAWPLALLGRTALYAGDQLASQQLEAALELFRQLGNQHEVAKNLACLGRAQLYQGDYQRAINSSNESLLLLRQRYDPEWCALAQATLGWARLAQGEPGDAYLHFAESLHIQRLHSRFRGLAECLEGLAALLILHRDQPRLGALLFGASQALLRDAELSLWARDQQLSAGARDRLAQQLADHDLAAALEEGQVMPLDETTRCAIQWAQPEHKSLMRWDMNSLLQR